MLDLLDQLNSLTGHPLRDLKLVEPERNDQAALTLPPSATKRPARPAVVAPQPTDQSPAPSNNK